MITDNLFKSLKKEESPDIPIYNIIWKSLNIKSCYSLLSIIKDSSLFIIEPRKFKRTIRVNTQRGHALIIINDFTKDEFEEKIRYKIKELRKEKIEKIKRL